MNFFKNYRRTLFLAAVLIIGALCLPGCKKDPVSPDGGDIVCKDGEAWVKVKDGVEEGFVFKADGDMIEVAALGDGTWHGAKVGTYSVEGKNLTMVFINEETGTAEPSTIAYKVSGKTLTLSGASREDVYTKKSGVYLK